METNPTEDIQNVVDLSTKKSEAEWQYTFDSFWLDATPKLFEWLGWIALLAGVKFIHQKSPTFWLAIVIGLCNASLLL